MAASIKQRMEAETKWTRHVELHKESGLSANEYCRQKGLDPKYFSLWRRRLQERARRVKSRAQKDAKQEFIRITPQQDSERIKIETPKGYRIEVGTRFDETLLRRLISVLS
jgi:hypothetical protein